ncbi:type 1 glutamine amidotransferase domain-containing protein [Actinoplanes siamensis]|uniref:Glutamine amidotransferase n=1 Tax=Actinoplanes siamensis TaxID=1223317 RepID=A0A919N3X6_9ACTN|nr:type 1 glutamine amidotransferase domain-containing protein [Actinoplanes siamensis]GIF03882.1 glutamine amidotransferase [Actinoplanes siamensis]
MADDIHGKRIAFLATDGVEEVEYTEPRKAVENAGGTAELISIKDGEIQALNHLDKAGTYAVDKLVKDAHVASYDALVLPGGVANPDFLRTDPTAVRFVRDFVASGKPVAAICHGPWTLVEAGAVKGRTLTSWPSLRTDVTNAGGTWVDEQVHVDGTLVTSRKPDDLPAFCEQLLAQVAGRA